MLNKVLFIGRLTRDPEIRFLPSGAQVTSFSIAVNRSYKTKDSDEWKEETYYFDVETFGALAERLGPNLHKGYQVLIEGYLKQERWETSSGEKRSRIKIVGDRVSIVNKPYGESNNQNKSAEKGETDLLDDNEVSEEIPDLEDEDVPF